ncbi:MAG: hypothetical protein IPH32_11285 [Bacteroidetes bacterium]|nr:hypothetical protein [Bacteroidota bacterium]
MKILNIFKKQIKKEIASQTQKLDKKQLEKVIGGTEQTLGGKAHYGSASNGKI